MSHQTLYFQRPASFSEQRYPFRDSATMRSADGVVVPGAIFQDARVYVQGASADQYVSRIELTDAGVAVVVNDASRPIASGVWSSGKTIRLLDDLGRETGVFYGAFSGLEGLASAGPLLFNRAALPLVPSCITSLPADGVDALVDGTGAAVYGDIWLVGGPGVRLEVDGQAIKVHLTGDRLFVRRACAVNSDEVPVRTALKQIEVLDENGDSLGFVGPDVFGNAMILPGDGESAAPGAGQEDNPIRLVPIPNGLQIQMLNTLG
jgi:hypothetical protein